MTTYKKYPRETMLDLINGAKGPLQLISDEMTGQRRWVTEHTVTFKDGDQFFQTGYERGSTEMQECRPWEDETEVTARQVRPIEKTITVYETTP